MGVINKTTEKINELLDKIEDAPDKIENGKTPVFVAGTTTTLDPGMSATAEVVLVGTDLEGNPQYKINIGVPKGLDGTGGSGGGVADSVQWANVLNKPGWVNSATKPTYTASEVGALPEGTKIPTKTSDIENDSGFLTSSGFKTINGESIVGTGNITIQGGGGSSGGTGNVNVTNASKLYKNNFYAFSPSENGSLTGEFSLIPSASTNTSGFMSSGDFIKLSTLKTCVYLPIAFEQVNSSTTKEELVEFFKTALQMPDLNFEGLVLILKELCALSNYEGSGDYGKFYIGNNDCFFRGSYLDTEAKLQTDFTYIALGGKLRTISILLSNIDTSDLSSAELSINVIESDDDLYFLSSQILGLDQSSTAEEIYNAFGGEEGVVGLSVAIRKNKKILVTDGLYIFYQVISSYLLMGLNIPHFSFLDPVNSIVKEFILSTMNPASCSIKIIYLNGYSLKSAVYNLKSSSTSSEISSALDGESGLKKLIKIVKDGNRLRIKSSLEDGVTSLDLSVWAYRETENGDLTLSFAGFGYGVFGGSKGGILVINFTKDTNEFSAQEIPIN